MLTLPSMSKVKAKKVADLKPKGKCCRSEPRCLRCPVVIMKMARAQKAGVHGKALKRELKRARAR